jgi:Flp pilus assembly pilin Flp
MGSFHELVREERGSAMAEYALLLALIPIATMGAIIILRDQISAVFESSASTVSSDD